jgi:hypothetical protein
VPDEHVRIGTHVQLQIVVRAVVVGDDRVAVITNRNRRVQPTLPVVSRVTLVPDEHVASAHTYNSKSSFVLS